MKINEEPVIVKQTFKASPKSVWQAITWIDAMRQWFFPDIPAFKPEPGFEARFDVFSGDRKFPHVWKITEVIPLKKIVYNWRYEGYAGDSFVVFELHRHAKGTLLQLTHTAVENFPDEIQEFRRESCLAGWKYLIKDRLKEYLGEH